MLAAKKKPHVARCLNCGAGTPARYCAECGQEAVDASVSFGDQIADFLAEVGTVEARLPRTMATLMRRPGELTRAYNAGQRVRYVTPLKVYLFASVAFFLIASLGGYERAVIHIGSATDHHGRVQTVEELDTLLSKDADMPPFLKAAFLRLYQSPKGFSAALMDTLSKATLALVPIHALMLKALYRRPRRLYGEHIVFSLHVHAFGYLAFALASTARAVNEPVTAAVSIVAFVVVAAYVPLAARTAYGEGMARSLGKAALIGAAYTLALGLVTTLAAAVAMLRI